MLIENDNVIETFAPDRANDSLDISILPGRSWRGNNFVDSHRLNVIAEPLTVRCVTIPQQIAGRGVPRKRLGYLACEPVLGWMSGNIEVNDLSSIVAKDDHGVEQPKRRGCNNEHVNRGHVGDVVLQEAMPGRGGDFRSPRHVSPDRGLAHRDTEFEQLAVDPRRTPKCVGPCSSGGLDHGSRCPSW